MADLFPPRKQRPVLLELLSALDARSNTLRRDECGDWALFGKRGWIYAVPEGFQLVYMSRYGVTELDGAGPHLPDYLKAKRNLAFCRLAQDGTGEGIFFLDRLPDAAEADTIRTVFEIRRRVQLSEEALAAKRESGKALWEARKARSQSPSTPTPMRLVLLYRPTAWRRHDPSHHHARRAFLAAILRHPARGRQLANWRSLLLAIAGEPLEASEAEALKALTNRQKWPQESIREFLGGHRAQRRQVPRHGGLRELARLLPRLSFGLGAGRTRAAHGGRGDEGSGRQPLQLHQGRLRGVAGLAGPCRERDRRHPQPRQPRRYCGQAGLVPLDSRLDVCWRDV
jgi:hypothetical protein